MPVRVREATPGDLESLVSLLAEINNLHAGELPHIYQRVAPSDETERYLRRVIGSDVLHLHVAEQDGSVVGFVVFQVEHAPDTPVHVPRQWVLVSLIVVDSTVRSRGIGTDMIHHVQAGRRNRAFLRLNCKWQSSTPLRLHGMKLWDSDADTGTWPGPPAMSRRISGLP